MKMTQRELERQLQKADRGIPYGLVSRVMHADREFDVWQAAKVEEILGIPAAWFGQPANGRAA